MKEMFVYATASSSDEAKKIAKILVDQRLAACVNIIPQVQSIYRWEGKITESNEVVMIMKTAHGKFKDLERVFIANHSYVCPALVAIPIEQGLPAFLEWVRDNTRLDA
jgi:periplasmic divalent cation tolerance protein